jgi:hypothetical protein
MTEIARDSKRGTKVSRKMLCVSDKGLVPVNDIKEDPRRQREGLTMATRFPAGKHEHLLKLKELERMAANGNIRSARDKAAIMNIDTFDAGKFIASGIMKLNEKINLEDVFPNIKTCPSKFSLNKARE